MAAYDYKAFISYSHADASWAKWLLQALETYRLPTEPGAAKSAPGVGKIFRDRDEAGAASDLKDEIERALAASEHLIVIASPSAAKSRYVNAEIEAFAAANARREIPGRILTLIVGGEPNISGEAPEAAAGECFPPALRGHLRKADGTQLEPLAADARSVGDGRTRALAKLVAGLLDIRYDTLVRRDLARRRQRQWLTVAAVTAGVVIAGAVTAVVTVGNLAREAAAREARTVTAINVVSQATQLLDNGDVDGAVRLARTALPMDGSIPFIPAAYGVLYRAVFDRAHAPDIDIVPFGYHTPRTMPLGDGDYLTVGDMGGAAIWSPGGGIAYRRHDLVGSASLAPDNSFALVTTSDGGLVQFDAKTRGWRKLNTSGAPNSQSFAIRDDQSLYGCGLFSSGLSLLADGTIKQTFAERAGDGCYAVAVSDTGSGLFGTENGVFEYDAGGKLLRHFDPGALLTPLWIRATPNFVFVSGAKDTYVFRRDGGPPVLHTRPLITDDNAISPTGRYIVETATGDSPSNTIYDLTTLTSQRLECSCWFLSFVGDDSFVTMGENTVDKWNSATLASQGTIYAMPAQDWSKVASRAVELPDGKSLLLFRQSGLDTLVHLQGNQDSTELMSGAVSQQDQLETAFFTDNGAILTASRDVTTPSVTARLWRPASTGGGDIHFDADDKVQFAKATGEGTTVQPLGAHLAVTTEPFKLPGDIQYHVTVTNLDTGQPVYSEDTSFSPAAGRDAAWTLLTTEDRAEALSASDGKTVPIDVSRTQRWSVRGSRLAVNDRQSTLVFDLSPNGARKVFSAPFGTDRVRFYCLSPDGSVLVEGFGGDGDIELRSTDLAAGKLLGDLRFSPDARTASILEASTQPTNHTDLIECDAKAAVLRDADQQAIRWAYAAKDVAALAPPEAGATSTAVTPGDPALSTARLQWNSEGAWLTAASGTLLARLSSAKERIGKALYLPDRGLIAIGYESGRVELWDVTAQSTPIVSMAPYASPVVAMDYDPTRGLLLTGDTDGTVNVWPLLTTEQLLERTATPS